MTAARANPASVTRLLEALVERACTYAELCAASGMAPPTVRVYVAELKRAGLVHIAGRRRNSRGELRVLLFRWAPGAPDATGWKLSAAQRSRIYRARRRGGLAALLKGMNGGGGGDERRRQQ